MVITEKLPGEVRVHAIVLHTMAYGVAPRSRAVHRLAAGGNDEPAKRSAALSLHPHRVREETMMPDTIHGAADLGDLP